MDSNIFAKRLEQLGIKKQVDAAMIVVRAQATIKERLGERGNDNLQVISFARGTLKIAATSGAWAAECRGIEHGLLREPIKRIFYQNGSTNREN